MCPHHLEVQCPPNLHSHSSKRALWTPPQAQNFGEGEQMGANREYFYTRLYGPHHLWAGLGKNQGSKGEGRGVKGVNMEQREQSGSEGSEGERKHFYTRF